MRIYVFLVMMIAGFAAGPGQTKPLLRHLQDTYVKACTDWDESYARLIELCETALNETGLSQSDRLDVLEVLGWSLFEIGETQRGAKVFNEMIVADTDNVAARDGLGWIAWSAEDYEAAAGHFGQSMAHKPSAEALAGLAASRFRTGELSLEEELAQLEAAAAIDPAYSWPLNRMGWDLLDAGRVDEAGSAFERALAVDEASTWALGGKAQVLRLNGRFAEALVVINQSIEIGGNVWDFYERAAILFDLFRYKQAIDDLDRVLVDWPEHSYSYVLKARALVALGREIHAIGVLTQAEENVGFDHEAFSWRAWLYAENGMRENAINDANVLVEKDASNPWAFERLGTILLKFDENAEARIAFEQALKLAPDLDYSLFKLAVLDVRDGDFDGGEKLMIEALQIGLPENNLREFIAELTAKFEYLRAVQFRVKARDMLAARDDS